MTRLATVTAFALSVSRAVFGATILSREAKVLDKQTASVLGTMMPATVDLGPEMHAMTLLNAALLAGAVGKSISIRRGREAN